MSKVRTFDPCQIERGGRRVSAVKITCAKCGEVHRLPRPYMQNCVGTEEQEAAQITRKLKKAGWAVGATAAHDRCPACAKPANKEARTMPEDQGTAAPPRQMQREDRRIIFEKLNEVYIDEKSGYSADWTDQKMADHLGVPRAWVVQIRDENFGPSGGNEKIAAQIQEADQVLAQAKKVAAEMQSEASKVLAAVGRLDAVMRDVRKAIGA
jgi:hypothetical protein